MTRDELSPQAPERARPRHGLMATSRRRSRLRKAGTRIRSGGCASAHLHLLGPLQEPCASVRAYSITRRALHALQSAHGGPAQASARATKASAGARGPHGRIAKASTTSPRTLHATAQRGRGAPILACTACKRRHEAPIVPCSRGKGLSARCTPVCARTAPWISRWQARGRRQAALPGSRRRRCGPGCGRTGPATHAGGCARGRWPRGRRGDRRARG